MKKNHHYFFTLCPFNQSVILKLHQATCPKRELITARVFIGQVGFPSPANSVKVAVSENLSRAVLFQRLIAWFKYYRKNCMNSEL